MTKMAGSCSTRFVPAQFRSNFSTFFSMIFRFGKGREVRLKTSKPLILRAFLVCRNYTVRAHLRHPASAKRSGCENRVRNAGPLQCRVHPGHLRPRDHSGAKRGSESHGTGADNGPLNRKNHLRKAVRSRRGKAAPGPHFFPIWVKIWVRFRNPK